MFYEEVNDSRRTLGIRDKQILYRNAKQLCENPTCLRKLDFDEMQVGHKTAWSRGGKTTLKNAVCLCYRCNKLQGTDSWAVFMKKQGVEDPKAKQKESVRQALEGLTARQLKLLADKHHIQVKGQIVEDFFESHRKPPTKKQYVTKLSGLVTTKELSSIPKETPKTVKKKRVRKSNDLW